jgi:hypothetical protein
MDFGIAKLSPVHRGHPPRTLSRHSPLRFARTVPRRSR